MYMARETLTEQTILQLGRVLQGQPTWSHIPILFVLDSADYDNQMLFTRTLNLLGAKVDVANDGLEGIEKAMSGAFDVVLIDLQMPKMGGVEATRQLRTKGYRQPIIALTAHALIEDRIRCLDVGCTDYLTKPIERKDLVAVLERAIRSTRVESPLVVG